MPKQPTVDFTKAMCDIESAKKFLNFANISIRKYKHCPPDIFDNFLMTAISTLNEAMVAIASHFRLEENRQLFKQSQEKE